jgi:3-deoxy-manno-octulosonate cytidylyltransferase (CMP-KDO synthetase)
MTTRKNIKITGVIPARWQSSRFTGKPVVEILGKPLLHWVIERVRQAEMLDGLLVATDDTRIRECALAVGAAVVMTRSNHPSGTDRIAEAVAETDADAVINIQGDEPLIAPALIDEMAATLTAEDGKWDMVTAAEPISDSSDIVNPDIVKVVFNRYGQALYFSRAVIPFDRDTDSRNERLYWRHIGIYGYTHDCLIRFVATRPCLLEQTEKLEQLRALDMGCRIKVLETQDASVGVDRPEDIKKVEELLRKSVML